MSLNQDVAAISGEIESWLLGTGTGNIFTSAYDTGKPVILAANQNMILATAGAEIDGFVNSVEVGTVGGYSWGGVLMEGRIWAIVGPNQGATTMKVGDYVVADTQAALGAALTNQTWTDYPGTIPSVPTGPTALVKTGTPAHRFWRCIRIIGTGAAGSEVLLALC
jgi:hypothetical protein